jgi:hypothetical protein
MKQSLPVVLNVYRINENSFLGLLGVKIFHTAIEYDKTEYSFGYLNDNKISGVFDIKPMSFEDGLYVESIQLGNVNRREFFNKMEKIKKEYLAKSYNLLTKNCNHFTNDFIKLLFGKDKSVPGKYTTLLKLGEFFRKIF